MKIKVKPGEVEISIAGVITVAELLTPEEAEELAVAVAAAGVRAVALQFEEEKPVARQSRKLHIVK